MRGVPRSAPRPGGRLVFSIVGEGADSSPALCLPPDTATATSPWMWRSRRSRRGSRKRGKARSSAALRRAMAGPSSATHLGSRAPEAAAQAAPPPAAAAAGAARRPTGGGRRETGRRAPAGLPPGWPCRAQGCRWRYSWRLTSSGAPAFAPRAAPPLSVLRRRPGAAAAPNLRWAPGVRLEPPAPTRPSVRVHGCTQGSRGGHPGRRRHVHGPLRRRGHRAAEAREGAAAAPQPRALSRAVRRVCCRPLRRPAPRRPRARSSGARRRRARTSPRP